MSQRFGRLHAVAIAVTSTVAAVVFWRHAFEDLESTGFGDWQYFHMMWEAGRVAFERWGEWALWNPFYCGGVTMWGNPQAQIYSPLFFLSFLFGTTVALKLFLVLHAAAGIAGMYVLARRHYDLDLAASILASAAWALSGFFAWHGAGGHAAFLPFFFTPWLVLSWRRAAADPRWSAAVAGILVLTLLEGGVYPLPYFVVLLAFEIVRSFRTEGAPGRVLIAASTAAVLTALWGAVRLWPTLASLGRHPRPMPSADSLSLSDVLLMLTAREHEWRFPPHEFVWPEYGTFVGWTVVVLGTIGVWLTIRSPGRRHVAVGAILFGWLMLGQVSSFSPWALLHELPVYGSLRVPSRFAVLFTFWFALSAAFTLERIRAWLEELRLRRLLDWSRVSMPWAIAAVAVVDLFVAQGSTLDRWDGPPIVDVAPSSRFHLVPGVPPGYPTLPQRNLGAAGCYDAIEWEISPALRGGDVPQVTLETSRASIDRWSRTANSIAIRAALSEPDFVVVNQNHAPGWESSIGEAEPRRGLLAVGVPSGQHDIVLRYRPAELVPAIVVSAIGAALALGVALLLTATRASRFLEYLRRLVGLARPGRG